jgi:hypothetical protein
MYKPQTVRVFYCLCFLIISLFTIIHPVILFSEPGNRDGYFIKSVLNAGVKETSTPTVTPIPSVVEELPSVADEKAGPGDAPWADISNYKSCTGSNGGTVELVPLQQSNTVELTDFNFSSTLTGSETLVGLEVLLVDCVDTIPGSATNFDFSWYIHVGGVPYGSTITDNVPISSSPAPITLGSPSSLSGFAITVSDVLAINFGVGFYVTASAEDSVTISTGCISIKLYYY